jgi:hypothetical protein
MKKRQIINCYLSLAILTAQAAMAEKYTALLATISMPYGTGVEPSTVARFGAVANLVIFFNTAVLGEGATML